METIKGILLVPIQLVQFLFCLIWWVVRLLCRLLGIGWWSREMTGQDYENFVAGYLRRQGFHHIQHTGRTGDLGVDFVAQKGLRTYAVQCKYYSNPVDGSAVQQVVAGKACYGCDSALVITNSTLTPGAWTLAETNKVEVLTEISPATEPGHLTLERFLTPTRLVGFAMGCVFSGVVLSRLWERSADMDWVAYLALAAGCFLLSGIAVTLWKRFWNSLLNR